MTEWLRWIPPGVPSWAKLAIGPALALPEPAAIVVRPAEPLVRH